MITNLKEVVELVRNLQIPSLSVDARLWAVTQSLSEEDYSYCRVRVQSVATLGLDDPRDFFLIKSCKDGWIMLKNTVHGVGIGDSYIPNAIYIQHEGRYAFVVGDFGDVLEEDSRGVPPL